MSNAFEKAVLDGIRLLRGLPRERARIRDARERLRRFREAHEVRAELVADWTSASHRVDYDLLLYDETHGTLALSQAPVPGSPWNSAHAEHWAAHRVLTIDGEELSVHDALRFWQARAALGPGWMDELLDEALISRALSEDDADIDVEEARRAARGIQRRLELNERAQRLRWLAEHGLDPSGFDALARTELERERWLDRMFAADGMTFFRKHKSGFDSVAVVVLIGRSSALAKLVAQHRPGASLLAAVEKRLRAGEAEPIEAKLERSFAWQLPPALRRATPDRWVGPMKVGGRCWIGQVLARSPRDLDDEVRASVRERLRQRWLRRARASADVQWHWL